MKTYSIDDNEIVADSEQEAAYLFVTGNMGLDIEEVVE